MSDVAREAALSEAALYRYGYSKEGLFALAIRHALLLAGLPGDELPFRAPSLAVMISRAREHVAAEVPFGALAGALAAAGTGDPAAGLAGVCGELFSLEAQAREAADMLDEGLRSPVIVALTAYPGIRAAAGKLRATPDTAATARLVLETLTWFAGHCHRDRYGAAIGDQLAQETAIDALLHALVPPRYLKGTP
jgi:AcrR family transcriptional regulator